MDKFVIRGGNPLVGTVRISGAKNSALPAMAAALLTDEPVVLENIPEVRDIQTMRRLLVEMGAEVELEYDRAHKRTTIHCCEPIRPEAPYELVKTMRASTLVLGPLWSRIKEKAVTEFLRWMLGDGQKLTEALAYAPLPKAVVSKEMKAIAQIQ